MDHSAGLDVSVKETSVCIVDETGRIVREVKVASEPEALLPVLKNPAYHFKRIGLEAGPLSQWLYSALAEAGLPVICAETRHMRAVLKAQINKTDRNDARGIAQMMRVGLYRPVHVKTLRSQKLRMLLTHRKLLQSKAIAIDNDLRGTLRNFGLKVGMVGKVKFEARIKELVENIPDLAVLVEPLLIVRRASGHKHRRYSLALDQMKSKIKPRRKQRLPERVMGQQASEKKDQHAQSRAEDRHIVQQKGNRPPEDWIAHSREPHRQCRSDTSVSYTHLR